LLTPNLSGGPAAEKRQLLILGIGLAVIAVVTWWLFGPRIPSLVLIVLASVALAGFVAYRAIGRDVFLVFMLLSLAIGHVVSWVIVLVLYAVVIAGLGSMLRLFGMNRLERNFEACRKKASMLADVPPLDAASFRRQS
jgi:ABC-type sugar transport system permease subunit